MTLVLSKRKNSAIVPENGKTSATDAGLIPLIAITGCDTGLGYSIVMRYLNGLYCDEERSKSFDYKQLFVPQKFAIVAFCLNPEGLGGNRLIEQSLKSSGVKLFVRQLDLTDVHSIKRSATFIVDLLTENVDENGTPNKTGRFKYELHALVNNAALMIMAEFEWQTPQMIQKQFTVNFLGPVMLTALLLPSFRKHKSEYFSNNSFNYYVTHFIIYTLYVTYNLF